ncbi:hypothetical protein APA73_09835 [Pseudomonas aeruginosa]|uniref:LysR family transcriptional regulator n=1 Tax=Pseudomonas aeruginosa TaxID=287 RepID=UPI00071BA360|nr:LysR family transcriptional regulator [Pseudomonas aeruginosa]KSL74278.1 hypothetical protein APA58_05040 [Pseudomonas aeruginosa]KSM85470.1 hypothetical protein APA73_09835 [Pseudomonas aeruginosa]MDI2559560.1 LysR family transcriptional regulator [Pseudomonas aeruginosa]HBN9635948.1 LysR family transcriptional regulator [Pseudomonas aeruginosa]HCF4136737.1 LysR family transcriptional regulator [Pseudomonas aeruginosa]
MRLNKFDLNNLLCLDALLAERSITRAADRLFLSRPAMSNALARLREYFNDELLIHVGKVMVPTPFALSLQAPVRDLLLRMQAIISASPAAIDLATVKRKISVTCSDYVTSLFIPLVLARIYEQAPGIAIDIRPFSARFLEEIDSGEVDFLITSDKIITDEHPCEPLFKDTFSCVLWAGNPDVGTALALEQYLASGHVVAQWGVGRVKTLDEKFFQDHHLTRRVEVWVSTFTQIPQCIVGTGRIGMLPTRLANWAAQHWPLRVFECPVPIPPLVEVMQWHEYQQSDPVQSWVREQFRQVGAMFSDQAANDAGVGD